MNVREPYQEILKEYEAFRKEDFQYFCAHIGSEETHLSLICPDCREQFGTSFTYQNEVNKVSCPYCSQYITHKSFLFYRQEGKVEKIIGRVYFDDRCYRETLPQNDFDFIYFHNQWGLEHISLTRDHVFILYGNHYPPWTTFGWMKRTPLLQIQHWIHQWKRFVLHQKEERKRLFDQLKELLPLPYELSEEIVKKVMILHYASISHPCQSCLRCRIQ